MALKIQQLPEKTPNAYRIVLEGRLDGATSKELDRFLGPIFQSQPDTIIFDMAQLDFISSDGIRVLIEAQKTLSSRKGSVILTDLQPQIQKVLEIIKALPGIAVFRNVEEMDNYLAMMQERYKKQ